MSKEKKVLIIAYYFPPRPGVASLRLKGLAKYLPEFGWQPVILTAKLPGKPDKRYRIIQTDYPGNVNSVLKAKLGMDPDKGLQEQVSVPLAIREEKTSFSKRFVTLLKSITAYPDEQKYWFKYAVNAGSKLIKKEKFDVILSSSGPSTCHLVAKHLKSKFNIPWVADFRDLWTQNHYYPYGRIRKIFEKNLELKTMFQADVLVTVSEPLAAELKKSHLSKKIYTITNGFDPDGIFSAQLTKNFTITYTGQLYSGKQDPEPLLKAINELITDGLMNPHIIKIRFYSRNINWLKEMIKVYNLQGIALQCGIIPHEEVLKKQRESQLLLLLNWIDSREKGVYTGKIFEYLASRRPILAIGGSRSVVTDLLEETDSGVCVTNLQDLKDTIKRMYTEYISNGSVSYHGTEEKIMKYSHKEMARRFAYVLDSIA